MEIWIRSQNKCKLRKADIVNYYYEGGKHIIDCNGYPVGTYDSKKRCLEIIDEIQKLLNSGNAENAFMVLTADDLCMTRDDFIDVIREAREHKAVALSRADLQVIQPSIVTYNMPEK